MFLCLSFTSSASDACPLSCHTPAVCVCVCVCGVASQLSHTSCVCVCVCGIASQLSHTSCVCVCIASQLSHTSCVCVCVCGSLSVVTQQSWCKGCTFFGPCIAWPPVLFQLLCQPHIRSFSLSFSDPYPGPVL